MKHLSLKTKKGQALRFSKALKDLLKKAIIIRKFLENLSARNEANHRTYKNFFESITHKFN